MRSTVQNAIKKALSQGVAGVVLTLGSTGIQAEPSQVGERQIDVPRCARPVAKVMVSDIKCKSVDCSGGGQQSPKPRRWWEYVSGSDNVNQPSYTGVGSGMSEMLATALSQTGCFEIMERAALDEINQELALVGKKVEAEPADFMITGSITSIGFEQSSTGLGGLGFLPRPIALIAGSVDWKSSKVWMNMDIRLVDIRKAKLVGSKTFEANNKRDGFGMSAAGWAGVGFGGSHASISGSPLEEVARDLLVRSTVYAVDALASRNVTERVSLVANRRD